MIALQPILRRRQLRPPDVRRAVNDLPLQVAEVDDVEVDDADAADAGRGEIHRRRRAEAAGADAQHAARLQLALPVHADLRHDQMPAVALDLVVGELGQLATSVMRPAHDCASSVVGAPPATDGMMLIVSPAATGVCSFCR